MRRYMFSLLLLLNSEKARNVFWKYAFSLVYAHLHILTICYTHNFCNKIYYNRVKLKVIMDLGQSQIFFLAVTGMSTALQLKIWKIVTKLKHKSSFTIIVLCAYQFIFWFFETTRWEKVETRWLQYDQDWSTK